MEAVEAVAFFAVKAVLGVEAGDEVVQVSTAEGIGLQSEVLVGAQVVDPERFGPGCFAGGFAVEEDDVRFDALGVEDASGETQEGVNVETV